MRLYLGLDNTTALSNEIAKVEIHYLPHYDLIKLHKIIFIFLGQRTPSYLAFSTLSLHEVMAKGLWQEEEGSFNGCGGEKRGLNFTIKSIVTQILVCLITKLRQHFITNQTSNI